MELISRIKYEGKSYADADIDGKHAIEILATKLQPLATEISTHPKGSITIRGGNVFIDSFPYDLAQKITTLL